MPFSTVAYTSLNSDQQQYMRISIGSASLLALGVVNILWLFLQVYSYILICRFFCGVGQGLKERKSPKNGPVSLLGCHSRDAGPGETVVVVG